MPHKAYIICLQTYYISDLRYCQHFINGGEKLFEKIKRLADAKGVSMYQISVETGIPYTCLADWKSGRSKPKFDKLVKLAKYFGVDVEYFAE